MTRVGQKQENFGSVPPSHVKRCACGRADARAGHSDCLECHALAQSVYRVRKANKRRDELVARINELAEPKGTTDAVAD